MLGKKGSNPSDDFDFDFGGSDELFSLDDPFGSTKEEKPPKGVKGYFKNVLKSVKNVGVDIGKLYLPDVKYLIDDLKEDDSDNPSLKEQARIYKQKGKEYVKMAKGIVKDMSDDVKKRIKTGYFYKSEEDSFDGMDFGFDENSFGGNSELGGLVDNFDESSKENPAPDSTESGEISKTTTNSLSLVTAKSAKASALASLKMHDDTINATLGATQYHIETENVRFNQSMLVESEHHRQKMIVMKNIASNVGKLVRQNNVSLKAQMEYSLKSLAFSNDMAAMIKEIRDVQWKALAPKKDENEDNVDLGRKAKIFGNGFNKKEWLKNFKAKSKFDFAGGSLEYLDMFKEMMGSMGDFGMKPADMVKSLIGSSLFEGTMNAILPNSLKNSLQRINRAAEGAPNAINNILGRIGREGISEDGLLNKALGKMGGVGSFLKNQIKNTASFAHVEDMTVSNTGKYTLKNPEDPHPFDNLAHKVLTEVIPKQLSMIEAGINNTEEKYFDYQSNSFKTISTIKNRIDKERQNVLEYSQGYSSAFDHTKNSLAAADSLKDVNFDVDKLNSQLIKNLFNAQTGLKDEDINLLYKRDKNGKLTNEIDLNSDLTNKILNDIESYSDSELTDQNKKDIVTEFIKGLRNLEKENPEEYINFQNGAGSYAKRLSEANIDLEKRYGKFGNSIAYDTFTKDEEIDRQIKRAKGREDRLLKQINDLSIENGGDKHLRQRLRTKYLDQLNTIKELNDYKEGKVGIVNAKESDDIKFDSYLYNKFKNITGSDESEIEEKRAELIRNSTKNNISDNYELKELKNTSTNSVVSNIYKLLLDGIIVYPRNQMDKDVENKYNLRKNALESAKQSKIEQDNNDLLQKLNSKRTSEELAREKLKNIKASREEMYEKSLFQEKLENTPFVGGIIKGISSAFDKSVNRVFKTTADLAEENLYGIHHGTTKKFREKIKDIKSNTFNSKPEEVSNHQDGRKEGTLYDQKLDKKEEKESEQKESQTKSLATIAATLTGLFKDGFKLDKSTMKEFEENNEELKEGLDNVADKSSENTSGILGRVNDLIDKSGLGNTKAGKAVKGVLTKTQDTINTTKGVLGKIKGTKLGQKVINSKVGAITAGIGGTAKNIFKGSFKSFKKGGFKGLSKHISRAVKKGSKSIVAKTAAKNKGLISKFTNLLKKFLDLVFKNPKFAKATGKSAISTIVKGITQHIPKIIGKVVGKIASCIAFLSTGVGALVKFGVGFANGAKNVRKTLGIGNDMKPTAAMIGICSLAAGLDLVLSEIPTLIAKLLGYKNFAQWLYSMMGSKAEKEAIEQYKKYCAMKATIYGIKDPEGLIAYQNRDGLDKAGRLTLNVLTLGLTKSNDEKDATLLGFNSVTIFKYWKENKYEQLEEIRKNVAEAYGGLKVVEKTETFTADKNDDNEISEDEQEEAEEQQKRIQNQQDFRIDFLNQARKWVIDNKLAWLNSSVTIEEFNKRTGKNATVIKSAKDKLKGAGKAVLKYGASALIVGPAGVALQKGIESAYKSGKEKMVADGTKVTVGSGTIAAKQVKGIKTTAIAIGTGAAAIASKNASKIKDIAVKQVKGIKNTAIAIGTGAAAIASKNASKIKDIAKNVLDKVKGSKLAKKVSGAIGKVKESLSNTVDKVKTTAKKVGQKLTDIKNRVSNKIKSCIESISKFFKKFLENAKIKVIRGINAIKTVATKLMEAIKLEASKFPKFAADLVVKTIMFTSMLPVTVSKAVISFLSGRKDPEKYLKIAIDEKNDKIKMAGGVVALINSVMPYANQACMNHYGKTLRRLVFDVVMTDNSEEKKDTYEIEKAKILGLTVESMLAYENKLNESSFGKKAKNFISNIFGGGADRTDCKLCGFSDITVFKFWREEKYEPLRDLEESIAHKFGDLDDLRSAAPQDPDAQSKFRQAYLREAKNYVKERGLEWLTYKTTKEELEERRNNKTLYLKSDAQVQKRKAEKEAEKPGFFKSIKNFFISSNRDTRGKAQQSYQNSIGSRNTDYTQIENTDTKAMSDTLQKAYKYDRKAMNVMAQASNSIKSFWKSISPNFYGDQPKAKVSADPNIKDDKVYAGNGGPGNILGTTQGLVTKIKDRVIDYSQNAVSKTRETLSNKSNEVVGNLKDLSKKLAKYGDKDSYDMSGKVPKATIMNSIVSDFAKNFGKELNKRLDILEEMHKESLRHNKVSEDFFVAALRMLQVIANNSNTNSNPMMSSQLDDLINSLTK